MTRPPPTYPLFPYTTSSDLRSRARKELPRARPRGLEPPLRSHAAALGPASAFRGIRSRAERAHGELSSRHLVRDDRSGRSEEHTSELQSRGHLVCRLLLEKN